MSEVLFNDTTQRGSGISITRAIVAAIDTPAQAADATSVPADPNNCTSLALDRLTNNTVVHPCPSSGPALPIELQGQREDLGMLEAQAILPSSESLD